MKNLKFVACLRKKLPRKNAANRLNWGSNVCPSNENPADILGVMDCHSGDFIFRQTKPKQEMAEEMHALGQVTDFIFGFWDVE